MNKVLQKTFLVYRCCDVSGLGLRRLACFFFGNGSSRGMVIYKHIDIAKVEWPGRTLSLNKESLHLKR